MNQRTMSNATRYLFLGISVSLSLILAACGGSGSSAETPPVPASATPISLIGEITGFGSIYVNGVEYDTNGASYDVDDEAAATDSALAVGMVVKVQGSVNADGRSGSATSISYDDEVEGLVESLEEDLNDPSIKTFIVMNTMIRVDENSTNFDGEDDPNFNFDTIVNGDNVEVSGEYSGDVLVASYIEKQESGDDDFEAKGTVTNYDNADNFVLVMRNGNTLDVTLAAGALIPSVGIANDQFVEVEGTIPDPVGFPDSLLATKVELEDEDHFGDGDNDEVEVKGILSYDPESEAWSVRDVMIVFDDNTEYKPESLMMKIEDGSAAGLTVEVEGRFINDVLQVEEIELEEDELEFKADATVLESTGPRDGIIQLSFGDMVMGTIDVVVSSETMFRDDEAMNHFDLDSIMDGAKVEIEARLADNGSIIASSLHLEDDIGYEIKGLLDAIDDVSLTVLSVVFSINENTFFVNGTPVAGNYVEIEDEDADGYADSVEIED